jgi:ABC-type multidrug transport system fused ATPase/permease subunit
MEFGNSPHHRENKKNPIREHANKIAGKNTNNNAYNIIIDGRDTHIPINLPVAVIGEKGSGKTTLINILMKLYKTDNNMIFIDGVDLNSIKASSLKDYIGYSLQDGMIYNDTIRYNLTLNIWYYGIFERFQSLCNER